MNIAKNNASALHRSRGNYVEISIPAVFLLGISSGLPFLLLLSTMSVWLTESGVSKTYIGLFALATLPYSLKIFISQAIEKFKIPILNRILGQRRAWIMFSQIGLIISLCLLANSDPSKQLWITALSAAIVGIFSAIQDIAVEVYRIESGSNKKMALGASASVIGYRVGMLISGAGALYIASYFSSFKIAYLCMSLWVTVGLIGTLIAKDCKNLDKLDKTSINNYTTNYNLWSCLKQFYTTWPWQQVISTIIIFKFIDTALTVMSMPFLIELGFNKLEIANYAKTFGISALMLGSILGSILLNKLQLKHCLLFCICCYAVSSLLFIYQANIGYNLSILVFTMGFENVTAGMSQVIIVTYLSSLSKSFNQNNTAIYYAMLTSVASFTRVNASSIFGNVADKLIWSDFYFIILMLCIPGIIIIWKNASHFEKIQIELES